VPPPEDRLTEFEDRRRLAAQKMKWQLRGTRAERKDQPRPNVSRTSKVAVRLVQSMQHSLDYRFLTVIACPPYLKWPLRDARSESTPLSPDQPSTARNWHEVKRLEQQ
jgi:hypothetical protein